jgi:NodT family efflux transporter outer membrane factor (OMF) lipoprotein
MARGGGGVGTGTDQTKGRAAEALRAGDNSQGLRSINQIGGLDAEWEIDIFGKIARRVEAQVYTSEALKEARDWVYVVIAADVARLYFDLRTRQDRLAILNRDIASARKVLDLAQTRLDRGLTNELDVLLARRQVETLEADVEPLKALIAANGYAIAVLVGEYPEALAGYLGRHGAVPRLPARAPVGLPVDLLRRRPDIREAERFMAAAVADIGARTADLFPSLVLTAGGGAQGGAQSGSGIPITWIGSVGPSIDAPILDFGALDARIEIADYRAHELAAAYKQTILVAVQQVDEANANYRAFRQSLLSLDTAINAARQATKVSTERYDRGLTDFLNVLDAERQQFALEAQRAEVVRLAGDSFVALYKALGGGWLPNEIIPPIRHPDPAAIAAVKHLIQDPPHSLPPPPPPGLTP